MFDAGRFVDFHSHILPGADHGSDSLATTLYQLNSAQKYGITKIISTSHFYPNAHSVDSFLKKRNEAFLQLLDSGHDIPEIRLGAEVLLCSGMDRLEGIERLCIHGTNTLLLELPFLDYCDEYTQTVERLVQNGLNIVLAHAERYPRAVIELLFTYGVKIQLNASSIVGMKKIKNKYLFDWMERGAVIALGSDIHGKDPRAYRYLNKAFGITGILSDYIIDESNKIWNSSIEFLKKEEHKV